jgi:hypothetical protein
MVTSIPSQAVLDVEINTETAQIARKSRTNIALGTILCRGENKSRHDETYNPIALRFPAHMWCIFRGLKGRTYFLLPTKPKYVRKPSISSVKIPARKKSRRFSASFSLLCSSCPELVKRETIR